MSTLDQLVQFLTERTADDLSRWTPLLDDPIHGHLAGRIFAECEAKRWIVESFSGNLHERWDDGFEAAKVGRDVLALLALPYADHPDYDESWRP